MSGTHSSHPFNSSSIKALIDLLYDPTSTCFTGSSKEASQELVSFVQGDAHGTTIRRQKEAKQKTLNTIAAEADPHARAEAIHQFLYDLEDEISMSATDPWFKAPLLAFQEMLYTMMPPEIQTKNL